MPKCRNFAFGDEESDDFDSSRRSSLASADHSTVSGSSIYSEHYSTSVTAEQVALYEEEEELGDNESMMMKMYGDDGYQHLSIGAKMQALTATSSPEFHSHMYRLQQTGIFIFDPYTMTAAVGDVNSPGLRPSRAGLHLAVSTDYIYPEYHIQSPEKCLPPLCWQ